MGFCLYVILYFELVLYSGKILVLDISSIFIGNSSLILISLWNYYCVKLAVLSVMCIPLYKDVMCTGKGIQLQAYRPIENVQPQSSVNPGYGMMDRVSIAQLMRPFFLKILNKRLRALLLITQKEHLQEHNLLLNGDHLMRTSIDSHWDPTNNIGIWCEPQLTRFETQQKYWNTCPRKLKFRFLIEPWPNVYKRNANQRYK